MKLVKPEAEMNDETFRKHMATRHAPFAGMVQVLPGFESLYRALHKRIHDSGIEGGGRSPEREVNHQHRSKTP